MRNTTVMLAIAILGFNGQATAFGDEPSVPTVNAASKAKEPTLLEKVAKYEKGKTTYGEVVKELGEPTLIMDMPGESKRADFSEVHFMGTSYKSVLVFDKNNILTQVMNVTF
jgi:hypothetical protein